MARKVSPVRQAYNRERKRIQNFLRRAEKRGFIAPEGILPDIPKKVTEASVRRLKKLTAKELYKQMRYVDRETGEIRAAVRGLEEEMSKRSKKAAKTRRERKEAEAKFWVSGGWAGATDKVEGQVDSYSSIPDGGEVIYANIVEDIIQKLSQPPSKDYTDYYYGKKRRRQQYIVDEIETKAKQLIDLIQEITDIDGKSAVGWRLQERASDVQIYIDGLMYASTMEMIEFNFQGFLAILKGTGLSQSEIETANAMSEQYESWE